jgi:hypothetical protein
MFKALLQKFRMWRIARSIKSEDGGTPAYEGTANIILRTRDLDRLPQVADATCGEGVARGGVKVKYAQEVLYSDGSLSTIEIRTDEESQRALKRHDDAIREETWKALHPNPSTSKE